MVIFSLSCRFACKEGILLSQQLLSHTRVFPTLVFCGTSEDCHGSDMEHTLPRIDGRNLSRQESGHRVATPTDGATPNKKMLTKHCTRHVTRFANFGKCARSSHVAVVSAFYFRSWAA